MSEFKVLERELLLDSKKNHMVSWQGLNRWEQLSRQYPRKGEYGPPTYRCRWCGLEVDHSPDIYLIGNFCSFSCHAGHGLYVYACLSIISAFFTLLTLDYVITYWSMLHSYAIVAPILFGLFTVWAVAGVIYGRRLRKATPRQYRHRESYDPRIRA